MDLFALKIILKIIGIIAAFTLIPLGIILSVLWLEIKLREWFE